MDNTLIIKNISKSYDKIILQNFNLEIIWNKFIWIFWPSWIGKTTLLKIIWWLIHPDHGQIIFNQQNTYLLDKHSLQRHISTNIGFIFQDLNLFEDFTVRENIEAIKIIWKKQLDPERIRYLLDYFEIKELLDKKVNLLSWWQKERVCIVRAIAHKPILVLADEAWSDLDSSLKIKTYQFLKDYSKTAIIIWVSHDENLKNYIDETCYLN